MKVIDAAHLYELGYNVDHEREPQRIQFVKKEMVEGKLKLIEDGTTTEQVIDMLINRLGVLGDRLPDHYTKAARYFLRQASHALQERTKDREHRGVEGTSKA